MRKYLLDKDGDIWTEADDKTLVCLTGDERGDDVIRYGNGESLEFVTETYGPLIPLVPDDSKKCQSRLSPSITCNRDRHDPDPEHRAIGPHGSTVRWS